jgi:hypothetical protein
LKDAKDASQVQQEGMWFLPPLFNMDLRKEHIRNMNHAETPGET